MNGKPHVPVINEGMLSSFMQAGRMDQTVMNGKLKIFSGTANSALSEVSHIFIHFAIYYNFRDSMAQLQCVTLKWTLNVMLHVT